MSRRTSYAVEQVYRRWWDGKYLADGRQIVKVEFYGPPSGVYGSVEITLDDGKTQYVISPPEKFKPRKIDLEVFDEPPIQRPT